MWGFSRFALVLLAALAATCPSFAARNLTDGQREDALRWAANNSLFTLYHEVTHLLIDKLNLPHSGASPLAWLESGHD